jgi:mono/diheme cytochrome c family protein
MRTPLRPIAGAAVLAVLAVTGCSNAAETTTTFSLAPFPGSPAAPSPVAPPELDPEVVTAGRLLYERFCAVCHGADLKGDPDWKVPNEDGSYPPPPQDSSGHTWHHGDDLLLEIILEGSDFPESKMPAFAGQLSEGEVLSILEFFRSGWGPQERVFQWEATLRERAG